VPSSVPFDKAAELETLLLQARDRGYLGEQAIGRQIEHSLGFVAVCEAVLASRSTAADGCARPNEATGTIRLLDLGSGGGIPGLVLALAPVAVISRFVLLEGSVRRAEWLRHSLDSLALTSTVEVLGERAELAGRSPRWRERFAVVAARSFGRPAVTAECAAAFLHLGGFLIVSEPPLVEDGQAAGSTVSDRGVRRLGSSLELEGRWPSDGVAELGFGPAVAWRAGGYRYAALPMRSPCPERYPRRNGIPAKRPLF
jgi:16S rRNA (guanine527-N7)-methyltransferase